MKKQILHILFISGCATIFLMLELSTVSIGVIISPLLIALAIHLLSKAMFSYMRDGKVDFRAKMSINDILNPFRNIHSIRDKLYSSGEKELARKMGERQRNVVLISIIIPIIFCFLISFLSALGVFR